MPNRRLAAAPRRAGNGHGHVVPTLLDANALWSGRVRLDFAGGASLVVAPLERREPVTVDRGVCVDGVRVEGLSNHQTRFAVRIRRTRRWTAGDKLHGGGEHDVARDLLPDELKMIGRPPHVLAAAGDDIRALGRVVGRRPAAERRRRPNILTGSEDPRGLGPDDGEPCEPRSSGRREHERRDCGRLPD